MQSIRLPGVGSVAGMVDVEAADGTAAQVPEDVPPEAFDLPISDMFANTKLLANVRTSDTVGELKTKLESLTGTEADALRVVLVDGDPPKQTNLEIETRTLEEYGVERGSKLMWQLQNAADAKQRRDDREAERLRVAAAAEAERLRAAKAKHEAEIRQATGWARLMVCGAAVSQAGWWSLYGDLGRWGGVIGIPLVAVGLLGFDRCAPGHSPEWGVALFRCFVDASGSMHLGRRIWVIFVFYAIFGVIATGMSAGSCPTTGTVPTKVLNDYGMVVTKWVSPEAAQLAPNCTDTCKHSNNGYCQDGGFSSWHGGADPTYCPLGSDTADCGCRNGTTVADWVPPQKKRRSRRSDQCDMGFYALVPLLFFFFIWFFVGQELAAIRRPKYVRRTSDGRTGVASPPFRRRDGDGRDIDLEDQIIVRWDDDGARSGNEAAEDFETLSFEAHVATRFGAP